MLAPPKNPVMARKITSCYSSCFRLRCKMKCTVKDKKQQQHKLYLYMICVSYKTSNWHQWLALAYCVILLWTSVPRSWPIKFVTFFNCSEWWLQWMDCVFTMQCHMWWRYTAENKDVQQPYSCKWRKRLQHSWTSIWIKELQHRVMPE